VELLHEVHPGRAAGRDQRQNGPFGRIALHELGGLFHDREVRAEVGVEDGIEAHPPQRGVGLAGEVRADWEAERLADCDANGRCQLGDAEHVGVEEVVPDLLRVVVLDDGAGGAVRRALAAAHARRLGQGDVAGRGNSCVDAALDEAEGPDVLDLLADLDAAPASDALARVEDDGLGRVVEREIRDDVVQIDVANAEVRGQSLQFAILVATAGQALVGMLGHDHLEDRPADVDDLGILGGDVHAGLDRSAAGSEHLVRAADADDADAAGRRGVQVRVLAQSRDMNGYLACRLKDGGARRYFDREAVDRG